MSELNIREGSNGLDLKAIHPRNGAKYSPNLHRWLAHPERRHRARTSFVYLDKDGVRWIGMIDNGDLIGARLMDVLCNGRKAISGAHRVLGIAEVEGFWETYMAIGRCAIDPDHDMHFVGDAGRWIQLSPNHKACSWCMDFDVFSTSVQALPLKLKRPRSGKVAKQCKEMGIEVGDTILGRKESSTGEWSEAKLTLLFAGAEEAVWKVMRRNKAHPRWKSDGEAANWTLDLRDWVLVSRGSK